MDREIEACKTVICRYKPDLSQGLGCLTRSMMPRFEIMNQVVDGELEAWGGHD